MSPMFNSEQVILVTGASSGIGQAIALQLNKHGATVLASGRNISNLTKAQTLAADPKRWINVPFDLASNIESLPTWVSDLRKEHGKLWGLVNAAGMGNLVSLQNYTLENAKQHYDLALHAPLLLAKGFADRRNYVQGGAILFITSASAIYPEKGHLIYASARAALSTAAKVISQEMAPRNLRVHCLAPGIVDTPLQKKTEEFMGAAYREEQLAQYPLGFGDSTDVAHMAAFLISEKARWITGQNFILDGGRY